MSPVPYYPREDTYFKFVAIEESLSGDRTIVAAVSGKQIRVLGYLLTSVLAVDVKFKSNPGGNSLSGALVLPINGNLFYAGGLDAPAFETASGQSLEMNLSLATGVRGHLTYIVV